jgi:hypothetical protein
MIDVIETGGASAPYRPPVDPNAGVGMSSSQLPVVLFALGRCAAHASCGFRPGVAANAWLSRRPRRGRENREHEQPPGTGVPHAVRHPLGCDQQIAGAHRQLAIGEQEDPFSLDDGVHLVHAAVRMERMRLSWLERVQPDEQPGDSKIVLLPILSAE